MKRTLFTALAGFCLAAPALAEQNRPQADAWKRWAEDFSQEMRSSMGTMFSTRIGSSKVVKGAPYSAEVVTESNQALADGNVISRKANGAIYRDGEGRTRQETPGDGNAKSIFINDPVEGKHFILTPGSRRAIEMPTPANAAGAAGDRRLLRLGNTEVRMEDGKVFIDGKEVAGGNAEVNAGTKQVRVENGKVFIDGKEVGAGDGPGRVVVKTIESRDAPDGVKREEVRVQVIRGTDDTPMAMPPMPPPAPRPPVSFTAPLAPLPPMPPMPGVQTMRFESVGKLGKGVTTNLGTKDIDGLRAEGKSTVWTIAAGEIGNRNPISVTSESWYSPELQATVYSRYNDPRTGESIYRLASIKRGEPAADLFQVPEDYKVRARGSKK